MLEVDGSTGWKAGLDLGRCTDFLAATSLPHSLHKAHVSELVVG